MGDWFQTIVDIDATPEQAPELATAVLGRLIERGVVAAGRSGCVPGGDGHAPGPNYTSAVTSADPRLHALSVNGLQVITGRTVFFSMGAEQITCPHCGVAIRFHLGGERPDSAWETVSATVDTWHSGGGDAHPCPSCGRSARLNEWGWEPPWGFGYLGFEFWNWPTLTDDFVTDISHQLGHRTVCPHGKL